MKCKICGRRIGSGWSAFSKRCIRSKTCADHTPESKVTRRKLRAAGVPNNMIDSGIR